MKKLLSLVLLLMVTHSSFAQDQIAPLDQVCLAKYKKRIRQVNINSGIAMVGITAVGMGVMVAAPLSVAAFIPAAIGQGGLLWGTIGGFSVGVGGIIGGQTLVENGLDDKVHRLATVVALIDNDQHITADTLQKEAYQRYLKNYEAALVNQLKSINKSRELSNLPPITLDELRLQMPPVATVPFAKRALTLIDVLARLKEVTLTTSEEYETFRKQVVEFLTHDTNYCAVKRKLYRMEDIAQHL